MRRQQCGQFGCVESGSSVFGEFGFDVGDPLAVESDELSGVGVAETQVAAACGHPIGLGVHPSFVFLPRSLPHTFTIETPSARMLLLNAPGGFERMFELAPRTPDEAVAALARYDVEVVGPHPRDAAS